MLAVRLPLLEARLVHGATAVGGAPDQVGEGESGECGELDSQGDGGDAEVEALRDLRYRVTKEFQCKDNGEGETCVVVGEMSSGKRQ